MARSTSHFWLLHRLTIAARELSEAVEAAPIRMDTSKALVLKARRAAVDAAVANVDLADDTDAPVCASCGEDHPDDECPEGDEPGDTPDGQSYLCGTCERNIEAPDDHHKECPDFGLGGTIRTEAQRREERAKQDRLWAERSAEHARLCHRAQDLRLSGHDLPEWLVPRIEELGRLLTQGE